MPLDLRWAGIKSNLQEAKASSAEPKSEECWGIFCLLFFFFFFFFFAARFLTSLPCRDPRGTLAVHGQTGPVEGGFQPAVAAQAAGVAVRSWQSHSVSISDGSEWICRGIVQASWPPACKYLVLLRQMSVLPAHFCGSHFLFNSWLLTFVFQKPMGGN